MLLPEHLEHSLTIFCEGKGIPIVNGKIEDKYWRDIQGFLNDKLKRDRRHTKKKEKESEIMIENIIPKIFGEFKEGESPIEEYLFLEMEKNKMTEHCRPQYEIGKYRVDFAFPIAKLAVECDGKEYHFTEQWQIERDQKRDKYLARKGWRVLHIEGLAIRRNIDLCIEKIKSSLNPFIKFV